LMCPGCAQKKNELHLLRQTVGKASAWGWSALRGYR
jgi:hypothetical protein